MAAPRPSGTRDQHGDAGHDERADDERADVEDAPPGEPTDVEQRAEAVLGVGQLGQVLDRIDDEDPDDQQRDEERRERGEPEHPAGTGIAAATPGVGAENRVWRG